MTMRLNIFKKEYRINVSDNDGMAPEDTLIDTASPLASFEQPIRGSIFTVFSGLAFFGALILVSYVYYLSVDEHEYFSALAFQNRSANFSIPAPRGIIFDRNHKALVKNTAEFSLLGVSRELKQNQNIDSELIETAHILGRESDRFSVDVKENMQASSIFFVARGLDKDQALQIEYRNPKGLYVISDTKREYLDGHKFSHIIGYTGKVDKRDLSLSIYQPTDVIGRLGLEAEYESDLKGRNGTIYFTEDKDSEQNSDSSAGNNLILNIDSEVQSFLYDTVWNILRESGLSRAAAVVQDPKTGAVRALVSFPAYNNNVFSNTISVLDYRQLFESSTRPLFNRVISGRYNPGSTVKPFIGMAALTEGVVTARDTIQDCISISVGDAVFGNWRPDRGTFDMKRAIADSCNVYFYSVGGGHGDIRGLGITKISGYLKSGLADQELGIDLPGETKGFVPTPEWKRATKDDNWYLGDTYNVSIGQGDLVVTPLWLNSYISAIANGGTFYKPYLVDQIVDQNGTVIRKKNSESIGKLPFSQLAIDIMREAMRETVLSGTARSLSDISVPISAKTGTAEVIKGQTVNALFTAFAPSDNPELALTILYEGSSSNQGYSIRAAHQFLKWYFEERKI